MTRAAAGALALCLAACADESLEPSPGGAPTYAVVHGWPHVPEGTLLGQCASVAVDAEGGVVVFRRAERDWSGGELPDAPIASPTLLTFDAETGELRSSVGEGLFVMPHSVTIGPAGTHLGRPWALTFDPQGHALVVDGGDQPMLPPDRARVVELDPDGAPLAEFGSFGRQDGQMIWPHDVAAAEDGAVYVVEVGEGKRAQKFARE